MDKELFLLDGHALVYRAHFAFINRPLINSKGLNTSAIAGFTRTLWDIIVNQKPSHLAVAFDLSGPTFRHEMYPEYKANRDAQPEDISIAIEHIQKIIHAFQIPIVTVPGYEADDVIGTLAKKAEKEGFQVYMVTPDKDYAQLVSDKVIMYKPGKRGGGVEKLGPAEVLKKWNISDVSQVIDVLGLQGDSSDNIPGVSGVGPKTASKLLAEYGSIENIIAESDNLKGKLKERIQENKDIALLSKALATIKTDCEIEFNAERYKLQDFDRNALADIFRELEFRTLARSVLEGQQQTLFSTANTKTQESSNQAKKYSVAQKSMKDKKTDYILVDDPKAIEELLDVLRSAQVLAFDTETTGLDVIQDEIVGLSFCAEAQKAYYVPLSEDWNEAQERLKMFKEIFDDKDKLIIGQNIKFDMNMLRNYDLRIKGRIFDTMVAHYLLEPDLRHGLDYLSESYLDYKMIPITKLIGKRGKNQLSMRDLSPEKILDYAAEDADITFQIYEILLPRLKEENLLELFETMEMPLIHVLSEMEINGVKLDADFLKDYEKELAAWIRDLEKEIHELAGVNFKVSSPKQVGEILFDRLKINYRWKKNASGSYSTSEEKLSELAPDHEIIQKVLQYRKYSKLLSTYVSALPKMIKEKSGLIHTSYNQARAATGRLSSESPNLQNIPIRDKAGRKIRNAFVPRSEDHILLAADYSQIELRLIAHLSGDEAMVEAFQKGQDIHRATAARVYDVDYDKVTDDQRRNAKTVNFSIIYGAGATNLSRQLDMPRKDAKKLIDAYFDKYPGLKAYMDANVAKARQTGYVETLMGRKRLLRDIDSRNGFLRSNAERMAINTPVQGTAADMIKIAMIDIHREMKERKMESLMILQVHDELVFDVKKSELEDMQKLVEDKMKNAMQGFKVPILVEMDTGQTWLEAH